MSPGAKATKWRESVALRVSERAHHYARRGGLTLEVTLLANGKVAARVVSVEQPEGRHQTITDTCWPVTLSDERLVAATVEMAKAWAEKQADGLAKPAVSSTRNRALTGTGSAE